MGKQSPSISGFLNWRSNYYILGFVLSEWIFFFLATSANNYTFLSAQQSAAQRDSSVEASASPCGLQLNWNVCTFEIARVEMHLWQGMSGKFCYYTVPLHMQCGEGETQRETSTLAHSEPVPSTSVVFFLMTTSTSEEDLMSIP